jgi:signal peptide peptidase SppA
MKRFVPFMKSDPLVAVVRLQGAIMANPRGAGLSDQAIAPAIERAFKKGKPAAVALAINSPGGSPAQSSLIAARIRRLSEEKKVPVHAFVEDVAASGGYWLACAADKIWADQTSILGSIGVISAGFGFHDAIAKIGVERRVHTAGASKSILDPFRPEQAEDVERLKALQGELHETFINHVTSSRGDRLQDHPELFTGAFWTGQQIGRAGSGRWHRTSCAQDERAFRRKDAVRGLWPEAWPFWSCRPVAGVRTGHGAGGTRGLRAVRSFVMFKIVTLFLVFMAVLAMFGRLRLPKITRRQDLPKPRLCKTCRRYSLRGGPCPHCSEGQG